MNEFQELRKLLGRDGPVLQNAVPAGVNVADVLAPDGLACVVPQRQVGEVLEQDLLCLGELLVGVLRGLGAQAFVEELVELGVRVALVVGAGAGLQERAQEVVQRRVVGLPAGAGQARQFLGGAQLQDFSELGERLAFGLDSQVVLEVVGNGVDPFLVAAVGVVRELQGLVCGPRADGVSLGPEFLRLGGIELQDLGTGNVFVVAVNGRGA